MYPYVNKKCYTDHVNLYRIMIGPYPLSIASIKWRFKLKSIFDNSLENSKS